MALTPSAQEMLETLHNPRWTLPGPTTDLSPISLDCVQNGLAGVFVASPSDPEEHGVEVWNDCKAGKYGPIGPYVAPTEMVSERMTRQSWEMMSYFQGLMKPLEPGPDRQMIFSELQAAQTVQGYHFSQIPQPWERAITAADEPYFEAGEQAFQDTVDYLNGQLKGRTVIPSFKLRER